MLLALLAACFEEPGPDGEDPPPRAPGLLVPVARAWAEAYRQVDAGVAAAAGVGSGFSALLDGGAEIAYGSRRMSVEERELARGNGFEPVEHVVGYDALAIYLHHDNPTLIISIAHLAEIYGEGGTIETWSRLTQYDIPGCDSDRILRFSRPRDSGTYLDFSAAVLSERAGKSGAIEIDDPAELVDRVKKSPCAIGYSSLALAVEHVKLACISAEADVVEDLSEIELDSEQVRCVLPAIAATADSSYPLVRPLVVATRGEPEGAFAGYLAWILSDAGQCILKQQGFTPLKEVSCPKADEPSAPDSSARRPPPSP